MDHLVLIDGHHMMYRAYWAIPRTMRTNAGEQTNAVFGMASMLIAILQTEQPDGILIAFDEGDQTFRHQENETYKEGRAETPDDFYTQIPRIMQLVDAFGFPRISDPQYEADDFLASYAKAGEAAGAKVTIVTGDRDLLQLAGGSIRVAIPHKGYQAVEYLGADEVTEKLGVTPEQVTAYKGLCGDSSDNLPGVRGIGPKTAAQLLQQYNTLDGVYEHLSDIRPAVAQKLEADKEQAYFCERMATLECQLALPISLDTVVVNDLPVESVLNLFTELEFTLLTKRFQTLLSAQYGQDHFAAEELASAEFSTEKKSADQMSLFA